MDNKDKEPRDLTWLNKFVKDLKEKEFFGELRLKFNAGNIVHFKEIKSGKPKF